MNVHNLAVEASMREAAVQGLQLFSFLKAVKFWKIGSNISPP
jgi:hypothetical protein